MPQPTRTHRIRRTLVAAFAALTGTVATLAAAPGAASASDDPGPLISCRARGEACETPVSYTRPEPGGAMTTAEFIAAAAPGARLSQREHGVPASVTIAQAILESGWGRSALSTYDKNFFGMKCYERGPYAIGCSTHNTSECTPAGQCYPTSASFRTYATAADSFRDHGNMLATNARYANAFVYRGDPDRFVAEMAAAGYATDPLYTQKLTGIMAKYNLYGYNA
jgi:flagellum-specific peptidoglycan hydrolase FlgJ